MTISRTTAVIPPIRAPVQKPLLPLFEEFVPDVVLAGGDCLAGGLRYGGGGGAGD